MSRRMCVVVKQMQSNPVLYFVICVLYNLQVMFKISDYTQTQIMVDTKSIQVCPASKFKLTTGES